MSDGEQEVSPRKKGRPAGKRGTFSFRVTAALRGQLETAAAAAARPVSEEIERRLEVSFSNETDLLRKSLFGDPQTEAMLRKIVWAARMVEDWNTKANNNADIWSNNEMMCAAMRKAIQKIVVDATPYSPAKNPLQAVIDGTQGEPDPIQEAEAYGFALGTILTGNPDRLAVNNFGMGPQTDW